MLMETKPYVIRVSSQKGGVGKTTIAVNLSVALSELGYKVLLIDSDMTNPSITYYLGLRKPNIGLRDVMTGKVELEKAEVLYSPTGMRILPEDPTSEFKPEVKLDYFNSLAEQLNKEDLNFVIFDTSPGIMAEGFLYYYDEALLVSTPELPAIGSAIRLARVFDKDNVKHNLVINRFNDDIEIKDVKEAYGKNPVAILPEDPIVRESLAKQIPVYIADKKAPFSNGIYDLVKYYSIENVKIDQK